MPPRINTGKSGIQDLRISRFQWYFMCVLHTVWLQSLYYTVATVCQPLYKIMDKRHREFPFSATGCISTWIFSSVLIHCAAIRSDDSFSSAKFIATYKSQPIKSSIYLEHHLELLVQNHGNVGIQIARRQKEQESITHTEIIIWKTKTKLKVNFECISFMLQLYFVPHFLLCST